MSLIEKLQWRYATKKMNCIHSIFSSILLPNVSGRRSAIPRRRVTLLLTRSRHS